MRKWGKLLVFLLGEGMLGVGCYESSLTQKATTLASHVQVTTLFQEGAYWVQAIVDLSSREYQFADFFLDQEHLIQYNQRLYGRVRLIAGPQPSVSGGRLMLQLNVSQAKLFANSQMAALPNGKPLPPEVFDALPAISPDEVMQIPVFAPNRSQQNELLNFYFAFDKDTKTASTMLGIAIPFNVSSLTREIFARLGFSSFSYGAFTTIGGLYVGGKNANSNAGFAIFIDISNLGQVIP